MYPKLNEMMIVQVLGLEIKAIGTYLIIVAKVKSISKSFNIIAHLKEFLQYQQCYLKTKKMVKTRKKSYLSTKVSEV